MRKGNKIILNREEVTKFLAEREKASIESCARVVVMNKEAEQLKEEVMETDKKLMRLI